MKRLFIILAAVFAVGVAGWVLWPGEAGQPVGAAPARQDRAAGDRARTDRTAPRAQVPPVLATLSGVVIRRGQLVPGAEVRLRADSRALQLTALTGEDGRFLLAGVPADHYLLSAQSDTEASDIQGPMLVSPGQHREDLVLELLPGATVTGIVADVRSRAPLPGATVRSSAGAVTTDHAGRFRLGPLPASMTWVEATAPGYESRLEWLQVDGAREHGGMELYLRGSVALRGKVTRLGEPAPGAQVWAERAHLGSRVERFGPVTTDDEGRFVLEVASGDFQLAAAGPGGARVTGPRLTVAEGGRYEDLVLELGQALSARGTVLLDGYPAAGASLMLLDARSQQLAAGAVTGAGGDFHFEGLAPGSFLVQAQAGSVVAQRGPFEVTGDGAAEWTIELESAGGVRGRVEPARAGVVVRARTTDWAGAMAAEALTGDDGRFELRGFPAGGAVELEAESDEAWAHARGTVGEEVVLRLVSTAVVGFAVDAQGRAVTDFTVRVIPEAGGMPRTRPVLHPRGEFRVAVPPGQFRVEASSPGGGETEAPAFTEVSAGRDSPAVKLELSTVEAVSGVVVDAATQEPLAGATVTVQRRRAGADVQFDRALVVATDAQGRFSLGGVPGRAILRFRAEGYREVWLDPARFQAIPEGKVALRRDGGRSSEPRSPYEGVGMQLRTEKETGEHFVHGVFDGSPAQAAGLIRDDQILAVDAVPTTGVPVQRVISWILGPSGTVTRLTMKRGERTFVVAVRRQAIDL